MPHLHTSRGTVRFCVLIPTRERAALMPKLFAKMPWLNHPDTCLGIEHREEKEYRAVLPEQVSTCLYSNMAGSVARAREQLRQWGCDRGYNYLVVTDDNAYHQSEEALHNLVRAAVEWPDQPVIMAGMHNTAMHFDRGKIGDAKTHCGLRSYPSVAMIFQVYPWREYSQYRYPTEAYGLDDRHFFLWCLSQDITNFRVCMDAPFTKTRYQTGGQGPMEARAYKTGRAIAQLAMDFPKFVGAVGTLRIPWQFLIQMVRAGGKISSNRLVGGAMRKEGSLQTGKKVFVKRKPHQ